MPGGRPTDYKPEYCQEIIEFMKTGKHVIQFAAHIGVAKSSIYEWAKADEQFSDALKKAQSASAAWWINLHQLTASGDTNGNPTLIIHMLKNKDKAEFGDQQTVEVKGEAVNALANLSSDTLAAIAKDLSNGK